MNTAHCDDAHESASDATTQSVEISFVQSRKENEASAISRADSSVGEAKNCAKLCSQSGLLNMGYRPVALMKFVLEHFRCV